MRLCVCTNNQIEARGIVIINSRVCPRALSDRTTNLTRALSLFLSLLFPRTSRLRSIYYVVPLASSPSLHLWHYISHTLSSISRAFLIFWQRKKFEFKIIDIRCELVWVWRVRAWAKRNWETGRSSSHRKTNRHLRANKLNQRHETTSRVWRVSFTLFWCTQMS